MKKRVLLSWSSGKDSAWALHVLRQKPSVEVVCLLTTINQEFDRVAMHAVRRTLLEQQASAANLPLLTIPLPWPCTNEEYERLMATALADAQSRFCPTHVAFGDLFLEDIRSYREDKMAETGIKSLFPLWGQPTDKLAQEMIAGNMRAILTCVDPRKLPATYAGRAFDQQLLNELPPEVDPCGENGEFHTFVWDGPIFTEPVACTVGEIVERDGFVFADVTTS